MASPRILLIRELDKAIKSLDKADVCFAQFRLVVEANCQEGDTTEKCLKDFPIACHLMIEQVKNLVDDIREYI